ncbi:Serine/threonine-protein kinase PknB [Gemmata sp. SH-PL17]|uniref:WD40 repeat domain-containing serine/threonine protein kinase n=1 Tax=Gemmata sp. SH-PL17 TaxID=1630693 RepID=UPI0004BBFB6B|nr:serine/threonine-protein kinase [Gemmata sp. SH-PL17]AMV23309.1 Serine/threonine-protein kinase PknB [Gemmata sp. SH-PL17]
MTTRRLTCPCGNAWDHPVTEPVPGDVRLICPACTIAGENTRHPESSPNDDAPPSGTVVTNAEAAANAERLRREAAQAIGPGRIISGYEIIGEINRGGMGVIYKARQPGVNRLVALKVIAPGKLDQPGTRARFKREVRASGRLSDPCIVTVFQTELDGPIPFVAMEYVPGIDLFRLVRQTGPLPVVDVVYYARQVAEGLQHAYEVHLVHRDIKPSNLMVSPSPLAPAEGRTGRLPKVKVLDMGLARVVDNSHSDPETDDLTLPGVFVGTPDYVAPEQAENPRAADTRSDLYSLGGAMYYCLTGEVPFPGKTLAAKLRKQLTEPPPSAAAKRSDVPVAVDAVIRKLMALDPNDRYQTPAELMAVLDAVLKEAPPKTGAKAAPTVSSVFAKAHDGGVNAMAPAPDGSYLLTGGGDSVLKFWHPGTLKELRTITGDIGAIEHLVIAPTGKWAATCAIRLSASDMGVQLWDLNTGSEGKRFRGPTDNISGVAISPDGKGVAAASADKMVWLWLRDATGPTTACIKGHTGAVTAVAFVATDSLLSSGVDGTVRQWDLKTGKTKGTLSAPVGPIAALAFAAKRVAVAGRDGLAIRQPGAATFQKFTGHDGSVSCCALMPDGTLLASGGTDHTVRVYRVEDGLQLATYTGHDKPVRSVAFAPTGDAVYSGDVGGILRRWPVPKAK